MAFNVPFSSSFEHQVAFRELPAAIEAVQQRLNQWEDKAQSPQSDLVLYKIRTEMTHLFRYWEQYRRQEPDSFESLIHTQLHTLNTRIEKNLDRLVLARIHFQAKAERHEKHHQENLFSPAPGFRPGHA